MNSAELQKVKDAVLKGDYENVITHCQFALEAGIEPHEILSSGLAEGMNELAKSFGKKGMYLDTVLWSTAAFTFGNMALQEALSSYDRELKARVVIGVPDGPWTIGPSVVKAVLEAEGFEVHDAGSDVGPLARKGQGDVSLCPPPAALFQWQNRFLSKAL